MNTTVTWYGKSNASYQFQLFPVGTIFYSVSGVYVACRWLPTGQVEALYVGEAQSLKDRLNTGAKNHAGLLCAARKGMTHIGAIVVPDYAERLCIDTDLRHGLEPSCNKQSVPRYNMS